MPSPSPSAVSRSRLRVVTAGSAIAGLVGLGVAVIPAAGASALGSASPARARTTTSSHNIGRLYATTYGFEKGMNGWTATNGASVAVTDAVAASGSKSLAIDDVAPGAGAKGSITIKGTSYVSVAITVEPTPAGQAADDDASTLVLLTMTPFGGEPRRLVQDVGDGLWHSPGAWIGSPNGPLSLEITLLQSCGSAIGRRLFIDDVTSRSYTNPKATARAAAASTAEPTSSPSITTPTTAPTTATATSSGTSPVCVGSTTIPESTAPTTTPTTTTSTPEPDVTLFSFEDGKKAGWKGSQGTSATIVQDRDPADGSSVLDLKAVKATSAGLTWTGRTSAFAGTGTWYHVVAPVRLERAEPRSSGENTAPEVILSVSGPIARTLGDTTVLAYDEWRTVGLWFLLDDTVGKKAAQVTVSLVQAPQRKCGAPTMLPTRIAVDAIAFSRTDRLPVTSQTEPTKAC